MCIALISTAHPSYALILIDNRDEYLNRPTAQAQWWPEPESHVLAGRDMLRSIHGTWLGVTKQGKIAVLTNYHENTTPPLSAVSRGAIIRKFLAEDIGPVQEFVNKVVNTGIARDAGGFSLVCGHVGEKLAVISNREMDQSQVPWIAGDVVHTIGLSNAAFGDHSWKKVVSGEELMLYTLRASVEKKETEDQLIQRLLDLLSYDTLPRKAGQDDGGLEVYIEELRNTIFVPAIGRKDMSALPEDEMRAAKVKEKVQVLEAKGVELGVSGIYGTQKQTVVLVDKSMNVRFFERTLYDSDSNPIPIGKGDVDVKFKIEQP